PVRRHPRRRPLQRHRHRSPPARRAVAPARGRHRRAGHHPVRPAGCAVAAARPGRHPAVRHLFDPARGKRGPGRSLPRPHPGRRAGAAGRALRPRHRLRHPAPARRRRRRRVLLCAIAEAVALRSYHAAMTRLRHRDTWLFWLFALLILATGLGLRDPWPADEPRFALVARQMVESGNWLFPMRGSELYPDKPPLFMWMQAALLWLTGELRIAFLLPSLLAALGTLWCVNDLGARLWTRRVGLYAGW